MPKELEDLLEELDFAAQQMRELSTPKKAEMETLTGFSANAIAHLYDKCAASIRSLAAKEGR